MTHYRGWTISTETGPNLSEMFRVRKMAANGVTALVIGPRFGSEVEALEWIDGQENRLEDIDPALYGLPQDSEIGPEFYPEPAREPVLEGYGALSTTEYQEGEAVEVLFPDGWRSGATFTGYRAGGPDEDFLRINVKLAEPGRSAEGCHPDCVRRPFPPAGWDVAEPGPEQLPLGPFTVLAFTSRSEVALGTFEDFGAATATLAFNLRKPSGSGAIVDARGTRYSLDEAREREARP